MKRRVATENDVVATNGLGAIDHLHDPCLLCRIGLLVVVDGSRGVDPGTCGT